MRIILIILSLLPNLLIAQTIPNDECATAELLSFNGSNQAFFSFNSDDATANPSNIRPSCENQDVKDGWYLFTMPFDGNILVEASRFTEIAIYEYDAVNCFGSEVYCGPNKGFAYELNSGTQYIVRAFKISSFAGIISCTLTANQIISNDACADAELLVFDGNNEANFMFNSDGATPSSGISRPSCENRDVRDGWYRFIMPFEGNVRFEVNSFSELAVYEVDGTNCIGTEIACGANRSFAFNLVSGTEYIIRAYKVSSFTGTVEISLFAHPFIANDECNNAQLLIFNGTNELPIILNSDGATPSNGIPWPSCESGDVRDGWYKFTMPFNGNFIVSLDNYSELAIYDSDAVNCLANEVHCGHDNSFAYNLSAGNEYLIRVYKVSTFYGDITGSFKIHPLITNDDCASASTLAFDANYQSLNNLFQSDGATLGTVIPFCRNEVQRDGWYEFTSPISGSYRLSSTFPYTQFVVYLDDMANCYGSEITCSNNNGIINVVHGQKYKIQIYPYPSTFHGDINFDLIPTITPVSTISNGTCEPIQEVVIQAGNNDEWVSLLDHDGNIVASINANGNNLGTITGSVYNDLNNYRTYSPENKPYLNRSITITPSTQPLTSVDVRLYLKRTELNHLISAPNSTVNNINDLTWAKLNGMNCDSDYDGNGLVLTSSNGSYNGLDYYSEFSVNSFSTFYASSPDLLPVQLTDFEATQNKDGNLLTWETSAEYNSSHFEILKSQDGIHWESIALVKAAEYSSTLQKYSYLDKRPFAKTYYKLMMVDYDQTADYSSIKIVVNTRSPEILMFPNPVQDHLNINLSKKEIVQDIQIYNQDGKLMSITPSTDTRISMKHLPSGIYFIKILTSENHIIRKVLKK